MPTNRSHYVGAIAFVVAVGLAATCGAASAPATGSPLAAGSPQAGSRIAFTSFRNGSFDLYVMNADGSKQRRLATTAWGGSPAWAPDGRRIAFVGGRGLCILDFHFVSGRGVDISDVDISVANADGSGLRRVTDGPGVDCAPAWSPDGGKIAFERSLIRREGDTVVGADVDIYVINADGSEERNLTGDGVSAGGPAGPIWSPDGRRIAFWSGRDGNDGIYVMNADGSGQRLLARNVGHVAWSPDGRKMLVVRGASQGMRPTKHDVFVMDVDGRKLRRLTRIPQVNGPLPSWSPDGRRIVFVSDRDRNLEIYVMNADGSGQRNVTRHPGRDSDPAWSPDGRKIAFTTKREGNFEIYVMNADGSGQRKLTRNPGVDRFPIWSPGRTQGS